MSEQEYMNLEDKKEVEKWCAVAESLWAVLERKQEEAEERKRQRRAEKQEKEVNIDGNYFCPVINSDGYEKHMRSEIEKIEALATSLGSAAKSVLMQGQVDQISYEYNAMFGLLEQLRRIKI